MPALSVRSYSDLLRRLLSLKGQEAIQNVDELLFAGIVLESDRPDWYFLRGQQRYTSGPQITATPAAGLFSGVSMRNPAGSKTIITIEQIYILTNFTTGGNFNLGLQYPDSLGGGVGNGTFPLDTREVIGRPSVAQFRITAANATIVITDGTAVDQSSTPAAATEENIPFNAAPGIVLGPNSSVVIAARVAVNVTPVLFVYRERPAEDSELPRDR
jgi:hypothetical protein